ncbi:MAG: DUF4254 domain-containing protein [Proteobacteria bacterium]|nr:DUF4254 domain-containing protein [Pseudomonadota bacterium]
MNLLPEIGKIAVFHDDCIKQWKKSNIALTNSDFLGLVEQNHAFNYQLWHAEDRARRDDMGYEFVYLAKREIDHCNQQRNNRIEAMDEWLFKELSPRYDNSCSIHSETPGMMIDRLSILALKAYHMHLQTERQDVDNAHQEKCFHKWQTLLAQQKQLVKCLVELIEQVQSGTRSFKIHYQFKMYNDPALNPELYSSAN